MRHSESIAKLATALAAAQKAFPSIPRDRTVTVRTKKTYQDGTPITYTFSYAPLDTVIEKTRAPLADNGLAVIQGVITDEKGAEFVRTTLAHSSGEWLSTDTPLFIASADNASQGYASGMTYARRYGYNAIVCVAADEDDDGNGNEDGQRAQRPQAAQRPSQPKPRQPAPAQKPATELQPYPEADFNKNLAAWGAAIESGRKTAADIVAMVGAKGVLTEEQKAQIFDFAPPAGETEEAAA